MRLRVSIGVIIKPIYNACDGLGVNHLHYVCRFIRVLAWHFETPQGPEAEQALPIRLLPELPDAPMPRRLQVRLWQSSTGNIVPERLREVLVLWQRSGFNAVPWWESRVEDLTAAGARELGCLDEADGDAG